MSRDHENCFNDDGSSTSLTTVTSTLEKNISLRSSQQQLNRLHVQGHRHRWNRRAQLVHSRRTWPYIISVD